MELRVHLYKYKDLLLSADNTATSVRTLLNPTPVGIVKYFLIFSGLKTVKKKKKNKRESQKIPNNASGTRLCSLLKVPLCVEKSSTSTVCTISGFIAVLQPSVLERDVKTDGDKEKPFKRTGLALKIRHMSARFPFAD